MRCALFNHHTPYLHTLATALPDVEFFARPTAHAPNGWRLDQRPIPANVHALNTLPPRVDAWIVQSDTDLGGMGDAKGYVVASHNRPEYEAPEMHHAMQVMGGASNGASVSISPMKTEAWQKALVGEYGSTHKPWHTILPGIDVSHYGGWTGEGGYVLTVANLIRRPLFDLDAWLRATEGLPVKLVGELNDGIAGAVGPAKDWEELKRYYRGATCYLSVNKWPHEDGYNLSLLEAAATGMPCFTLAKYPPGTDTTPQWTCMRFDAGIQLRGSLAYALQGVRAIDREQGAYERECVARDFPLAPFAAAWRKVLDQVAGTHAN